MEGIGQDCDDDGYSLSRVPPHMASSDLFTPNAQPRPTQTSIGYYLVKNRTEEDMTFGVHKAAYSGVGDGVATVGANVPRTHHHLRTGVDESIPPRVKKHNRKYIVAYNRGLYASPVEDVGDLVFATHLKTHVEHDFKKVEKSIFPRSVVYELDYIKNEYRKKMLAALERERAEFEEKVKKKRELGERRAQEQEQDTMMPKPKDGCPVKDRTPVTCDIKPPFWWPDQQAKRDFKQTAVTVPEDHTGQYTVDPNFGTVNVQREMKLDDPNEYQPGQVYRQRAVVEKGVTADGTKGEQHRWSPKDPNFHKEFDPKTIQMTSPLYESVKKRQQMQTTDAVNPDVLNKEQNQMCHCKCHTTDEHLRKVVTSSSFRPLITHDGTSKVRCELCGCQIQAPCSSELGTLRPQDAIEVLGRIDDDRRELAGRHLKGIKGVKPYPFPGEPVRYGSWDNDRQKELAKVGLPFKTEAARWMEKNSDPLVLDRTEKPIIPWNIGNL